MLILWTAVASYSVSASRISSNWYAELMKNVNEIF